MRGAPLKTRGGRIKITAQQIRDGLVAVHVEDNFGRSTLTVDGETGDSSGDLESLVKAILCAVEEAEPDVHFSTEGLGSEGPPAGEHVPQVDDALSVVTEPGREDAHEQKHRRAKPAATSNIQFRCTQQARDRWDQYQVRNPHMSRAGMIEHALRLMEAEERGEIKLP